MIFYSDIISNRLQYIVNFIAKETGIEDIEFTQDRDKYYSFIGPKINYSKEIIAKAGYWVKPVGLLFENDIKEQVVEFLEINDTKIFFETEGDFPFDVFAASFYLLSRYEEYLPHEKDSYGRYAYENSLAFNVNFLKIPLVNQWLHWFKKSLAQKFPSLSLKSSSFVFLPTYDIDEAFSYKHKGLYRSFGGIVKDLLYGKWNRISTRLKVLMKTKEDPYDAYAWMDKLHEQYNLKPNYFFLVAEQRDKYDKNILPKKKVLQSLIKQHNRNYSIGIHPSWQSGDETSLLKKEIQVLQSITEKEITVSRQHYIRFTLPTTYRLLIDGGIKEDYSMGYGSINGFRASVASSFYWYDLEKEEQTDLLLHPFCYMEANSFYEQKMSSADALEEMLHYLNEVKKVNGTLVTIWHNTFLGTEPIFAGWREVYEQFIKEATR